MQGDKFSENVRPSSRTSPLLQKTSFTLFRELREKFADLDFMPAQSSVMLAGGAEFHVRPAFFHQG
ncbi:hypothetical protein, partial [Pseudomonas syringae]|uniref:hypothetical protein n=1 Tax=Pseudomonas syringae TaxID=317 RepID=UPI001F30885B